MASQSYAELQKLYAITESAYISAEDDYLSQQALLSQQLAKSEDIHAQIEGLPALMSVELERSVALPIYQSVDNGNRALVTQIEAMRREMAQQAAENRQLQQQLAQVIAQSSQANAEAIGQAVGGAVQTATYQAAVTQKATMR